MIEMVLKFAGDFLQRTPAYLWLGCFAAGIALEFVWKRAQPEARYLFNLKYSAIYLLAIFILGPLISAATVSAVNSLGGGHWVDLNVFGNATVPAQLATFVLFMLITDFFYYWLHRLQHKSSILWNQHEVHHSDTTMNVTTNVRHHWTEILLHALFITVPFSLLFNLTPAAAGVVATLFASWQFIIHLNARLPLGRWSWMLVGPQVHRIHHSSLPQHQDKNFAAYFPVWDVLFGTYHAPARDEYPPVGLASGERIDSVWSAAIWPFARWHQRLRGNRASDRAEQSVLRAPADHR